MGTLARREGEQKKMNTEELKRQKARQLRYKKAVVKNLNLETIQQDMWDIIEECENVRWYWEEDDDSLINALDGDEDEAEEFKMMFADLIADCERMQEDMQYTYIPECFDDIFTAIGAGDVGGGLIGWDAYEGDYFGFDASDSAAEEESKKRLMRLTKQELIEVSRHCFRIMYSYLGLKDRFTSLKAAMDILKSENTAHLKVVKEFEEVYEKANAEGFYCWNDATKRLDKLAEMMPPTVWLQ